MRAKQALAWRAGVVRHVPGDAHVDCALGCYAVELDVPVTANDWTGTARRYGGEALVGGPGNLVFVNQVSIKLFPGELIRSEGG